MPESTAPANRPMALPGEDGGSHQQLLLLLSASSEPCTHTHAHHTHSQREGAPLSAQPAPHMQLEAPDRHLQEIYRTRGLRCCSLWLNLPIPSCSCSEEPLQRRRAAAGAAASQGASTSTESTERNWSRQAVVRKGEKFPKAAATRPARYLPPPIAPPPSSPPG